jgi:hypothetical protein
MQQSLDLKSKCEIVVHVQYDHKYPMAIHADEIIKLWRTLSLKQALTGLWSLSVSSMWDL